MAGNSFGKLFKLTTFGESHGIAIGGIIDGCPPNLAIDFEAIQAAPVGYTYADGAYSDITEYYLPEDAYRINVKLLYQTTSKEYIEFLRDLGYRFSFALSLSLDDVRLGLTVPNVESNFAFFMLT